MNDYVDLRTAGSIMTSVDIQSMLNEESFNKLPSNMRQTLLNYLPVGDRVLSSDGDLRVFRIGRNALRNEYYSKACLDWRKKFSAGFFFPNYRGARRYAAERYLRAIIETTATVIRTSLASELPKVDPPIEGDSKKVAEAKSSDEDATSLSTKLLGDGTSKDRRIPSAFFDELVEYYSDHVMEDTDLLQFRFPETFGSRFKDSAKDSSIGFRGYTTSITSRTEASLGTKVVDVTDSATSSIPKVAKSRGKKSSTSHAVAKPSKRFVKKEQGPISNAAVESCETSLTDGDITKNGKFDTKLATLPRIVEFNNKLADALQAMGDLEGENITIPLLPSGGACPMGTTFGLLPIAKIERAPKRPSTKVPLDSKKCKLK